MQRKSGAINVNGEVKIGARGHSQSFLVALASPSQEQKDPNVIVSAWPHVKKGKQVPDVDEF
ncbi:hypothetical protein CFIMG_007757RA00001 [Ceratocystis fimbriata CBS 114723]|uniref:Uncharacterized protein n=1 Tax=Ceratocystis fimbriata CBS 114723 TaxID=1035309 RepID=A0A2C5WV34_9PEZI|nr:hypothetical protein CFIMG_007757RA00001 [Ceratocystis fimbriata CBS 114723]